MRFARSLELPARPDRAIRLVHDLERWGEWLTGARDIEVDGDDVSLVLDAPLPLAVRLQVSRDDDGVAWELIEGDLSTVAGRLRITRSGNRSLATWSTWVGFPIPVPSALLREVEDEVVPRWLERLAGVLRKRRRR